MLAHVAQSMRTRGTAAELEVRRRIAARLFREDITLADVARCVDASISSVKRWRRAWKQGGVAALAAKPQYVPRCRLSDEQKRQLVEILLRGPLAAGYFTDLWTCARVAQVIDKEFGVTYHADHVGRLLHSLGFTPQKPRRRAASATKRRSSVGGAWTGRGSKKGSKAKS